MNIKLSDGRYIAALFRMRERVITTELVAYDDTTVGDKSMHCSWGLCSGDKAAWPDKEDHMWPDQFESKGRVAPLYTKTHQRCPLDHRDMSDKNPNGCFYTCRVFQSKAADVPKREQAIALYDARLEEALKRVKLT